MSSKLKEFRFTCWTRARTRADDLEVPAGETVEPDSWIAIRGAELLPADQAWWDGEVEEPDWDQGCWLADARTGEAIKGTNMAGPPMQWMIDAWRSGRRQIDGILIGPTPIRKAGK